MAKYNTKDSPRFAIPFIAASYAFITPVFVLDDVTNYVRKKTRSTDGSVTIELYDLGPDGP